MDVRSNRYRHTKIIATLGPATESPERIAQLITAGVDVLRLNMAHATHEWVRDITERIRSCGQQVGRQVAVMMDVKGPEIRTGALDQPIDLVEGERLRLWVDGDESKEGVHVNYPDLPSALRPGQVVLVDSGLIRLRVISVDSFSVLCEVLIGATLGSRRHINLPGVVVNLPALTEKDEGDIRAGVEAGVDFIALSFVRRADDVGELRAFLDALGSKAQIISKIEEQAGVANMTEIVSASDGVMVARGDLGIEIDYHQLPLVQLDLVEACLREGKPVIIATHLLDSMIHSPVPTRAEVSDVCNAIREQADAVMLSGETTTGAYPLESVEVFKSIIASIEPTLDHGLNTGVALEVPRAKLLHSAAVLAQDLDGAPIIVFTRTGFLARMLAGLRPWGIQVFAFTDVESTFRHCLLPWGIEPFLVPFSTDFEETIAQAFARLKDRGWCDAGDWTVVVTNALAGDQVIDTLQLRRVS